MRKLIFIFLLSSGFLGSAAFADESGVIINGKKTVLFRDGKKVADMPAQTRKPSSLAEGVAGGRDLFFVATDGNICYSVLPIPGHDGGTGLSCVKQDNEVIIRERIQRPGG